jgi:hypothetical protein
MMSHGLAVFILTDLSQQFEMDTDCEIGRLLESGYCRYDEPQSYALILVNPLVNKMLAALKKPTRLDISDGAYDALQNADYLMRVHDTAELAVLELMRRPNLFKFSVIQKGDREVVLEIEMAGRQDWDIRRDLESEGFQSEGMNRSDPKEVPVPRKMAKKVAKEEIDITAVRLPD